MSDLDPSNLSDNKQQEAESTVAEKKLGVKANALTKELESIASNEDKLKKVLSEMESILSDGKIVDFKYFWDIRGICLQLFKESIHPAVRTATWEQYSHLSKEARKLKDALDQESSFAAEQIEIAIVSLENQLLNKDIEINKIPLIAVSHLPKDLKSRKNFYVQLQQEMEFYNLLATKINSLRKELIKTDMRIRLKNKFFERLSKAGDAIFPARKELIKNLSQSFLEDVNLYIKRHFNNDTINDAVFVLKEDIKTLQGLAKFLTLNTQVFTETRVALSKCWDQLKELDKERKKEWTEKKEIFKENYDKVLEKLNEYQQNRETQSLEDNLNALEKIALFMKEVELGREEVKDLKEKLQLEKEPLLKVKKEIDDKRLSELKEKETFRKKEIEELKAAINQFKEAIPALELSELKDIEQQVIQKINVHELTKQERLELDKQVKGLKSLIQDAIFEKQQQSLLSLTDDEKASIMQYQIALKQCKEKKNEIKNSLEQLKKTVATGNLSFERSMEVTEQIKREKERLEKINLTIKDIEEKLE